MTFEEAQKTLQDLLKRISAATGPAELLQIKRELYALEEKIWDKEGFSSIQTQINEIAPRVSGQITTAVVADIQSRDSIFNNATAILNDISREAEHNAEILALEKPKLILPAITKSVEGLKEVRDLVKEGNYTEAAKKAETLMILLEQVRAKIKPS